MGLLDRFRRTVDAPADSRRTTPRDDRGQIPERSVATPGMSASLDQRAEPRPEIDRIALGVAAEIERLAAEMAPEIDRVAAEIEAEVQRAAEEVSVAEADEDDSDLYAYADTLRRSEYLPRERERDALDAGADGLPRCRLTRVRDQLVLASPEGLINPKSPHAYKVGIFSFSVRGTRHYERAEREGDLSPGRQLRLVREPSNKFDSNAVGVHAWRANAPFGYVNKLNAKRLAPLMDAGADLLAISLRGSAPGLTGLVPYVLAAERRLLEHLLRDTTITLK